MGAGDSEREQLLAEGTATAERIRSSGATIYNRIDPDSDLYFPTPVLEVLLCARFRGMNLDLPIRTRSKRVKEVVADALGYRVPKSFRKEEPRFPGQNLGVAAQVATNFQPWNVEIDPVQRYAFVIIGPDHVARHVVVRPGELIAQYDKTGTLTSKFQASRESGRTGSVLVGDDTDDFKALLGPLTIPSAQALKSVPTSGPPQVGFVLPIAELHRRLLTLEGRMMADPGATQDRRRGELLQAVASDALQLGNYVNRGQWPDLLSQAVEVKLQTSPTIDLGLVLPSSEEPAPDTMGLSHCDVRYVVAYATIGGGNLRIDEVVVTTGRDFFTEFRQFGGLVTNSKLQLRLPTEWWEAEGS